MRVRCQWRWSIESEHGGQSVASANILLFSLAEWSADKLLHFQGREKNVVFDAVVALVVILSFHRIQHWVNHRVERLFFRHWHKAAEKLRHFLDQAALVSQASVLQEKFMRAIVEFCGAQGAALYAIDASGDYVLQRSTLAAAPASIDANHDVAIELRHAGKFVELLDVGQGLPGDLAFPMMARGRLGGIVLLGGQSGGEHYRPDQVHLLSTAVHQFGLDVESLRVELMEHHAEAMERRARASEQSCESLKRELAALHDNNRDLRTTNEGLLAVMHGSNLSRA